MDGPTYAMPAGSHGFRLSGMIVEETDEELEARRAREGPAGKSGTMAVPIPEPVWEMTFDHKKSFALLRDEDTADFDYDCDELT